MICSRSNAPRRYFVDGFGRRVLIGLTHEETLEFERLDRRQMGQPEGDRASNDRSDRTSAHVEACWSQLYAKHERGWKAWLMERRTEQDEHFSLS